MTKPLILVVEDNAVLQRVIQLLSRKYGVDVDVVSNGRDALVAFDSGRDYSLILMDWRMPDMDGLECTKAIRERERQRGGHLPIVAMTANVDTGHREACMEVGMDDYMSKPFTNDEFGTVLHRWVRSLDRQAAV